MHDYKAFPIYFEGEINKPDERKNWSQLKQYQIIEIDVYLQLNSENFYKIKFLTALVKAMFRQLYWLPVDKIAALV